MALPSLGPSYLAARSAEVILSDVRPVKLKHDALQAINLLLDEVLYNILAAARSLATDKLKAALVKVLPTSLGKQAVLEAEVELKAYWERTTPRTPLSSRSDPGSTQFDLQWSYELLRLKCEAYSTMNDSDEDANAEKQLQRRMEEAGSSTPPNPSLLAPAALYLTAILEAICQHVLSYVSRVTTRDSSRTLATVQDLFVALCEDEATFGMFKFLKVYEKIEALANVTRARRSKSFSRTDNKPGRSSISDPPPPPPMEGAGRQSTDSARSGRGIQGGAESRASVDKGRAITGRIFHSRSLSEKSSASAAAIARSNPYEFGNNRELDFEEDAELVEEFDELMRSASTMKVSLTPDRLKSMEVYKQERSERANRRGGGYSDGRAAGGAAVPAMPTAKQNGNGRPALRHVDSIVEDDEDGSAGNHNPLSSPNASHRMRQVSLTSPSPTSRHPTNERLRSISISNVPHPRHDTPGSHPKNGVPPRENGSQNGFPARKRKVARNRESLDLDEVMAGSGGEEAEAPPARIPGSPRGSAKKAGADGKPYVSKAARDLIDFLEEGPPPEEPVMRAGTNASVMSFDSTKTRSSRLQRMVSKLTLGGSKEGLHNQYSMDEGPKTPKTPRSTLSRKNSTLGQTTSPPPSFKAPPVVTSKRSFTNVVVATPPPRYTSPQSSQAPQSTQSSLYTQSSLHTQPSLQSLTPAPTSNGGSKQNSTEDLSTNLTSSTSLKRRSTRKAVPPLEGGTPPSRSTPSPALQVITDEPRSAGTLNGYRNHTDEGSTNSSASPSVSRRPSAATINVHVQSPLAGPDSSLSPRTVRSPRPERHQKAESGYVSRSASRSPITPSERLPLPPAIPSNEVEDLRSLMSRAGNADECRLLMDMFLARNGLLKNTPATPPIPVPAAATFADAVAVATLGNDDLETDLVALFLGGGRSEDVVVPEAEVLVAAVAEPAEAPMSVGADR